MNRGRLSDGEPPHHNLSVLRNSFKSASVVLPNLIYIRDMLGKLPWIIYQSLATILKKGGWPLVLLIVGLVAKGVISTYEELKKYIDEWSSDHKDGTNNS